MKEIAFRLKEGQDLKKEIEKACKDVDSAVVLSGVGSLKKLHIRLAKAEGYLDIDDDFEIVSLTGTSAKGYVHIHICVSDDTGKCYGGHLEEGCLINSTGEIVLGVLEGYNSTRIFDEQTGYHEICFEKVK